MSRKQEIRECWSILDDIRTYVDDMLMLSDGEVHEVWVTLQGLYSDFFPVKKKEE